MKSADLILITAGIAVFFIVTKKKTKQQTTEIVTDGDAEGWRYFSDGTSISPEGIYYMKGAEIYNPNPISLTGAGN